MAFLFNLKKAMCALPARKASTSLAALLLLSACATSSSPGDRRPIHAAPGFKGKTCEMVSPDLNPDLMRPGKPATVRARAHFVDGEIRSVKILSGPVAYRQPVIDAMKQYTCAGGLTFVAEQKFVFGVDPLSGRLGR
ncbi:MAG: hypothetical protein V4844_12950 [Pseudomonadota bacterium]